MDVRRATEALRTRGIRITRQRAAVLLALGRTKSRLSPPEILRIAQADCPELGLATVYRTLDLFAALGIIRRVHATEGCTTVVGAGAGHGHTVVCLVCGRAAEFSQCDMVSVENAAARETGFKISAHSLELAGTCAECQGRNGQSLRSSRDRGG